jgi:hypothetical protein
MPHLNILAMVRVININNGYFPVQHLWLAPVMEIFRAECQVSKYVKLNLGFKVLYFFSFTNINLVLIFMHYISTNNIKNHKVQILSVPLKASYLKLLNGI